MLTNYTSGEEERLSFVGPALVQRALVGEEETDEVLHLFCWFRRLPLRHFSHHLIWLMFPNYLIQAGKNSIDLVICQFLVEQLVCGSLISFPDHGPLTIFLWRLHAS